MEGVKPRFLGHHGNDFVGVVYCPHDVKPTTPITFQYSPIYFKLLSCLASCKSAEAASALYF